MSEEHTPDVCLECDSCGRLECCSVSMCKYVEHYQGVYDQVAGSNERMREALEVLAQGTACMLKFVENYALMNEAEMAQCCNHTTLSKVITAWALQSPTLS